MFWGDKHVQAAVAHRLDWAEGTLSAAASWVRFLRPGFFPLSPALPLPIRGPGIVGPTQRSEEGGWGVVLPPAMPGPMHNAGTTI